MIMMHLLLQLCLSVLYPLNEENIVLISTVSVAENPQLKISYR